MMPPRMRRVVLFRARVVSEGGGRGLVGWWVSLSGGLLSGVVGDFKGDGWMGKGA
jgi:hypothetical protein